MSRKHSALSTPDVDALEAFAGSLFRLAVVRPEHYDCLARGHHLSHPATALTVTVGARSTSYRLCSSCRPVAVEALRSWSALFPGVGFVSFGARSVPPAPRHRASTARHLVAA